MDNLLSEYVQTLDRITAKRREVVRKINAGKGDTAKLIEQNGSLYAIEQELVWAIKEIQRSDAGNIRF